jgi:hypothetical protein
MITLGKRMMVGATSLGMVAMASVANSAVKAEPPGIYYSWRAMNTNVTECIGQASQALESQNLNPIQTDAISIAGRSADTTAVFVCMESSDSTMVMVIVASSDDDQALALREALKQVF